MIKKFYISENNVIMAVAKELKHRKGYVKPLFIKDAIPTIVRAYTFKNNIIVLA